MEGYSKTGKEVKYQQQGRLIKLRTFPEKTGKYL